MSDINVVEYPWFFNDSDDPEWYDRFIKYYLVLGPARNILKAYRGFLDAENPEKAAQFAHKPMMSATTDWSRAAREYDWRRRADAYDQHSLQDYLGTVEQARRKLMESTKSAVETLVSNLESERYGVAAAKEILDRGGVPSVSKHDVSITPYTADEFAAAAEEVKKWEAKDKTDTND